MLHIELKNNYKSAHSFSLDFPYHIGETINLSCVSFYEELISIQADGDELEEIRSHYPALCSKKNNVQNFYGDIAKMLLKNCFVLKIEDKKRD